MKTYICVNHGECNWADEKPPREFSLPDSDENVCPNCEKNNIKELERKSGTPWKLILMLLAGLITIGLTIGYWPETSGKKEGSNGVKIAHPVSQTQIGGTDSNTTTSGNSNTQNVGEGQGESQSVTVTDPLVPTPVTWTRVPDSEFCDDLTECVQVYSERNNLGQTRERKIENCEECGAAKK